MAQEDGEASERRKQGYAADPLTLSDDCEIDEGRWFATSSSYRVAETPSGTGPKRAGWWTCCRNVKLDANDPSQTSALRQAGQAHALV
jgi:hypothetical protein